MQARAPRPKAYPPAPAPVPRASDPWPDWSTYLVAVVCLLQLHGLKVFTIAFRGSTNPTFTAYCVGAGLGVLLHYHLFSQARRKFLTKVFAFILWPFLSFLAGWASVYFGAGLTDRISPTAIPSITEINAKAPTT